MHLQLCIDSPCKVKKNSLKKKKNSNTYTTQQASKSTGRIEIIGAIIRFAVECLD